jgi:hypothetical protein
MNILINVISSHDIEICAQACAKINTILYNNQIQNVEEACYLIASVEKVMYERVNESKLKKYFICHLKFYFFSHKRSKN